MDRVYLGGVDLGGTKVTTLIANSLGEVIARQEEPLQVQEGHFARWRDGTAYYGVAVQIEELIHRMMASAGIYTLAAIGIGAAGPLQHGAVKNSTNIIVPNLPEGLPEYPLYIPLTDPLHSSFSVPVCLENDCNTAVIGEVYHGVGKKTEDKSRLHLVYVTVSTGLGAGAWVGGHILQGKDGNAAEIGHIVVKENGLRCGCGNYGCAEAYCSGSGIVKNARTRLINENLSRKFPLVQLAMDTANKSGLGFDEENHWQLLQFITPPLVFQAADAGDPLASKVIEEAAHYGGIALAVVANAYDPEVITLGGSIAISHPKLIEGMREEMQHHLNVAYPAVEITPLGRNAVEYGAIALAQRVILE